MEATAATWLGRTRNDESCEENRSKPFNAGTTILQNEELEMLKFFSDSLARGTHFISVFLVTAEFRKESSAIIFLEESSHPPLSNHRYASRFCGSWFFRSKRIQIVGLPKYRFGNLCMFRVA